MIPICVIRPVTVQSSKSRKTFFPFTVTRDNGQPSSIIQAAAMTFGNIEIPSIATALDREDVRGLVFQICPRGVNDPTFRKPDFVVRISRVEYDRKGLEIWAIPSVQSYQHLQKTNYIGKGLVNGE